jgi:hypothetical protein
LTLPGLSQTVRLAGRSSDLLHYRHDVAGVEEAAEHPLDIVEAAEERATVAEVFQELVEGRLDLVARDDAEAGHGLAAP